ncbi:MAG: sigma-70 family RNA polymerase sigma factor [Longimicrobiales bacterium]
MNEVEGGTGRTVTELLHELAGGRSEALGDLMPLVYGELKQLAKRHLRGERTDHTLSPTGLVHEAYLRLVEIQRVDWQDRAHFHAMASRAMRRVLIDHARAKSRHKRGGEVVRVTLDDDVAASGSDALEWLALGEALERLESISERACRVVECRVFGGLEVEDTARALGISAATVKRDWAFARAWLNQSLEAGATG